MSAVRSQCRGQVTELRAAVLDQRDEPPHRTGSALARVGHQTVQIHGADVTHRHRTGPLRAAWETKRALRHGANTSIQMVRVRAMPSDGTTDELSASGITTIDHVGIAVP